jgi:hypothetical protein
MTDDDIKTGGPAFPISLPGCGDNGASGMTLRDWFAGQALAGLQLRVQGAENAADWAYLIADAMLKRRSK